MGDPRVSTCFYVSNVGRSHGGKPGNASRFQRGSHREALSGGGGL